LAQRALHQGADEEDYHRLEMVSDRQIQRSWLLCCH